jgi:hypothetical protein
VSVQRPARGGLATALANGSELAIEQHLPIVPDASPPP